MIRQIDEGKRRFCRSLVGCGLGRVLEWPCASRAVLALSGAACVTGCSDVTLHADVVIVGGGGAGLAAAVSAAERKLSVILLEKEAAFGGNTAVSTGLFSAVDPVRQKRQGIEDSEELYAEQMLQSGRGKSDPKLVRTLAHEAPSTLCWLESMGMRFSDELIESYGSHWVRDHRPLTANGLGYVRVLVTKAMQLGVDLRTNSPVTNLLTDKNGVVTGVRVVRKSTSAADEKKRDGGGKNEYVDVLARHGVILASGGFGANPDMVARYAPNLADLTTDNAPGNTGEMIVEAARIGAALRDMSEIQCLPGCPKGRTHRVRLHTDVSRFIMVNHDGRRFVREDGRRDDLRDAVLALPERFAYSIVDNRGLESHNILVQKETVIGVETGDAFRADSLEELARKIGVPAGALIESVETYNHAVATKRDPFGCDPMNLIHEIRTPPFWACLAGMTIHTTMGGIAIDEHARVLDALGRPIPKLFAAGETTGGVHGANRLGAHGLPDALTFGRIAGKNVGAEKL